MAFDNVRLNEDVERGAQGGPGFKTSVIAMSSGHEQRNQDWQKARARWDIGYGMQDKQDFLEVHAFFYARRGRARGFRFKDWGDFEATSELLGLGNGTNRDFQLIRTYEAAGPNPYVRIITMPVVGTITVRVSGVVNPNWTLQANGLVRFNIGNAPANLAEVTADYEFDVPVRFDTDDFAITLEMYNAGAVPSLPVIELRDPS